MSKSILVVDENPDVLALLTHLLEPRGVRMLRARTKAEALELLGRDYVAADLVLFNVMIARTDPCGLKSEIDGTRPGLTLMFMSAYEDAGVIRVEVMNRVHGGDFSGVDQRGVVEAVMCAIRNSGAGGHGA